MRNSISVDLTLYHFSTDAATSTPRSSGTVYALEKGSSQFPQKSYVNRWLNKAAVDNCLKPLYPRDDGRPSLLVADQCTDAYVASVLRISFVFQIHCVSRNTKNGVHLIICERLHFEAYFHKHRSAFARRLSDWYHCPTNQHGDH